MKRVLPVCRRESSHRLGCSRKELLQSPIKNFIKLLLLYSEAGYEKEEIFVPADPNKTRTHTYSQGDNEIN